MEQNQRMTFHLRQVREINIDTYIIYHIKILDYKFLQRPSILTSFFIQSNQ